MPLAAILLAAGQGTRMRSDLPKVLHPLGSAPLIAHALAAARALEPERTVVVVGHGGAAVEAVARGLDEEVAVVTQAEQKGTGHAVLQALPALDGFAGDALVLYGDTPLIRPETLRRMLDARAAGADVVVLGFEAADPAGYGRLVVDGDGCAPGDRRGPRRDPGRAGDHPLQLRHPRRRPRHAARPARRGPPRQRQGRILSDRRGEARPRPRADGARPSPAPRPRPSASTRAPTSPPPRPPSRPAPAPRRWTNGVTLTDPATVWFALDTVIGRDVDDRPERRLRPRGHRRDGRGDPRLLPPRGLPRQPRRPHRPVRPAAPGRGDRRGRAHRQLRRDQERDRRGGRQGQPPELHRRRPGRRAAPTSAPAPSPATTTASSSTAPRSARAPSSARTARWSRRSASATARWSAAGSVVVADVPAGALAIARGRQEVKPGLGRRMMERLRALKAEKAAS